MVSFFSSFPLDFAAKVIGRGKLGEWVLPLIKIRCQSVDALHVIVFVSFIATFLESNLIRI